jgi:catecholate siderophore receptor
VGTPNNGASVADGRAPVHGTPSQARNLGLYAQDTVSLTDTLKLVGGLRYDDFKASYRNPNRQPQQRPLRQPVQPARRPDLPARCELSSYYVSYGTSYNTSGDTYQFGPP